MMLKWFVDKGWKASNRYAAVDSEKSNEEGGLSL